MELKFYPMYDIHLSGEMEPGEEECNTSDDNYYEGSEPTYHKYGGYNGWDDDTIDAAFEGMPEATWNVD